MSKPYTSSPLQQAYSHFEKGDVKQAHKQCVSLIQAGERVGEAYQLLAQINVSVGQLHKAAELCKHAIAYKNVVEFRVLLCRIYALLGQTDGVIAIANTVQVDDIQTPIQADTLGVALSTCNEHARALVYFSEAVNALNPTPSFLYNYAVSSKFCGELEQAKKALWRVLDYDPTYYKAHFALSELTKGDEIRRHLTQLKQKLDNDTQSLEARLHLSHSLARELEKQRNYTQSFDVLTQAKQEKQKHLPYNEFADRLLFDYLKAAFASNAHISPSSPSSQSSTRPIFVVGMPRSGTTLVERILSSHQKVSSGGELQDFSTLLKQMSGSESVNVLDVNTLKKAESIDYNKLAQAYLARTQHIGNSDHFVDKLPFNFFYLPYIRRAFHNAKIICLQRNPMDTCMGNFRQLFSIHNPHYYYTHSLVSCASFYRQCMDWVEHWHVIDDDNFMLLNYEALVCNPTRHIADLLAFCELSWDESCLHMQGNTAPVSTASKMQVKMPINQHSIGRWQHYKPHTNDLEAIFNQ